MSEHNFVLNKPKFTRFPLFNAVETVVNNAVDHLSIS